VEPAPDEIAWNITSDAGLGKDEIDQKKFWDHFTDMSDKKSTKAILVYFYWPEEDNDNEDIQNMIRRCKLMDKILEEEAIRRASVKFHCFKCSFKDMSEELKKQIFLPFFTTKDISEGTGLGLAVVHGIVTSHGGKITVKTREGEGTRFLIQLPLESRKEFDEGQE